MAEPPSNPDLVRAIAATLDADDLDTERAMRPMLGLLVESTLVSARDPIVTRGCLALFTDLVELHLFEAETPWVTMRADEAIKEVARGDYEGLVVNPGPRQMELSRDDVLDMFDIENE